MTEMEIVGGLLLSGAVFMTFGLLLIVLFVVGKSYTNKRIHVIPGSKRPYRDNVRRET